MELLTILFKVLFACILAGIGIGAVYAGKRDMIIGGWFGGVAGAVVGVILMMVGFIIFG